MSPSPSSMDHPHHCLHKPFLSYIPYTTPPSSPNDKSPHPSTTHTFSKAYALPALKAWLNNDFPRARIYCFMAMNKSQYLSIGARAVVCVILAHTQGAGQALRFVEMGLSALFEIYDGMARMGESWEELRRVREVAVRFHRMMTRRMMEFFGEVAAQV